MLNTEQSITAKADNRGRISLGAEFGDRHVTAKIDRSIDLDELEAMRAVHFLDASEKGRASLYAGDGVEGAEALIGVDWGTGPVWAREMFEEMDNSKAIADYNAMERAAEGAIIAAYYGRRQREITDAPNVLDRAIVLGICPPGSVVRAIPVESVDQDGTTWVKTLPLVDTVQVTLAERKELFTDFAKGGSIYNTPSREQVIREEYEARCH